MILSASDLAAALRAVTRARGSRKMPGELQQVHVQLDSESLALTCTNLQVAATATIDLEGQAAATPSASFLVPPEPIQGLLEGIRGEVGVELVAQGRTLRLSAESGQAEVRVGPADAFPTFGPTPDAWLGLGPTKEIAAAVAAVKHAAIPWDPGKPDAYPAGLEAIMGGTLAVVGISGHRVATFRAVGHARAPSLCLPVEWLTLALACLTDMGPETVFCTSNDSFTYLIGGGLTVRIRRVEKRLPANTFTLAGEIAASAPITISIDRKELLAAVERASAIEDPDGEAPRPVVLAFDESEGSVSMHSDLGSASQVVACVASAPVAAAFAPRYLHDALKTMDTESVTIHCTDATKVWLFVGGNRSELIIPRSLRGALDEPRQGDTR